MQVCNTPPGQSLCREGAPEVKGQPVVSPEPPEGALTQLGVQQLFRKHQQVTLFMRCCFFFFHKKRKKELIFKQTQV